MQDSAELQDSGPGEDEYGIFNTLLDADGYERMDVLGMTESVEGDDDANRGRWGWATGLGMACLSFLVAGGVLVCLAGIVLTAFAGGGPVDVPSARWWSAYVVVALCWGVFIGGFTFFMAYRSRRTADVRPIEWLLGGAVGLVLALFWPGLVIILAGFLAVRSVRPVRLRAVGVGLAAVTAIVGSVWGGVSFTGQQLQKPKALSTADVVGTWRSDDGGVIVLQGDGTVSVTGASGLFAATTYDSAATETGTWTVATTGDVGLIAEGTDVGNDSGKSLQFYDVDSRRILCTYIDPDAPCDQAFYKR